LTDEHRLALLLEGAPALGVVPAVHAALREARSLDRPPIAANEDDDEVPFAVDDEH
jgi:hypothetical protein